MDYGRACKWGRIADTAVVALVSIFWAIMGWLFAQIMFPDMQFMVPVTITLIHVAYLACHAIMSKRAPGATP